MLPLVVFEIGAAKVLVINLTYVANFLEKTVAFLVVTSLRSFSTFLVVLYGSKGTCLCLKISLICIVIGCSSNYFFLSFAQQSYCFEYCYGK